MRESVVMPTLVAEISDAPRPAPIPGLPTRASRWSDRDDLGRLYFEAYGPGVACATLPEAVDDIEAAFGGHYGAFWFEASPVIEHDSAIVAAIQTVHRAPWRDTPDGPFIIELFTNRSYRRRGLARHLLLHCMATLHRAGAMTVALRVEDDNAPARNLYESLGFKEYE